MLIYIHIHKQRRFPSWHASISLDIMLHLLTSILYVLFIYIYIYSTSQVCVCYFNEFYLCTLQAHQCITKKLHAEPTVPRRAGISIVRQQQLRLWDVSKVNQWLVMFLQ